MGGGGQEFMDDGFPLRGITVGGGFVAETVEFAEFLWGGNGIEDAACFAWFRPRVSRAVEE